MNRLAALLTALCLTAGCSSLARNSVRADARLEPRSGSQATGTVRFTQLRDGRTKVTVDMQNVAPGVHGIHVHQIGDCSAPDAASAGPHFDPTAAPHGGPMEPAHHAGDFGNVTANADGRIRAEFVAPSVTVTDGPNSVVGKAVVLHADPDDLRSQPAGNSGKRIACGVVSWTAGSQAVTSTGGN